MKSLQGLEFKPVYGGTSGPDALNDFLIPALSKSIRYDRVAGYFSSAALSQLAHGLAPFVAAGGKMRLITSHSLTAKDIDGLTGEAGEGNPIDRLAREFEETIENAGLDFEHKVRADYLRAMCWLVKHGYLEIRLVIPANQRADIPEKFHSKFGLISDAGGDTVVFAGSINETWLAWSKNLENISIYKSWEEGFRPYIEAYQRTFADLWEGKVDKDWETIELPEALKTRLFAIAPEGDFPDLAALDTGGSNSIPLARYPRDYQEKAVSKWEESQRVGLLEMATGTGKTFTARLCITSAMTQGTLLSIVVAPYQHIADQWARELADMNVFQVGVRGDWKQELQDLEFEASLGIIENLVLIAVKNTASSNLFLEKTNRLAQHFSNFLLIGDEVHWLGAPSLQAALNPRANFRLGLSATPDRYFDVEGTQALRSYFGPESAFVFDLKAALEWVNPATGIKGVLTNYEYHPIFVSLTAEESERFSDFSRKIAMKTNKKDKSPEDYEEIERLQLIRAEIAKKAQNKEMAYSELLTTLNNRLSQTLIYCADFQQMERVMEISRNHGISTASRITGLEGSSKSEYFKGKSEREHILQNFSKGNHEVLFAIDCLDEGVDIPSAEVGIILASSGNPKEFIQRRGRLMRKHPGKTIARIFDFVVIPEDGDTPESLKQVELRRVAEFAELAVNRVEVERKIQGITQGEG